MVLQYEPFFVSVSGDEGFMGFFSLIIRKMSLQTFGGPFTTCVRPSSIKACVVSLRFVSTIHGLLFISFMFL